MVKEKACPRCGSEMNYRLGAYECPRCGYGEGYAAAPVEPPPAVETIRMPSAAPPPEAYGLPASSHFEPYPSLKVEKVLYLVLRALVGVAITILAASFASMFSSLLNVTLSTGDYVLLAAISVTFGGLDLGVMWFVLFKSQAWTKYSCGGWVIFTILASIPGWFMPKPQILDLPGIRVYRIIYSILVLAADLWLVSILWRDIKRLQAGSLELTKKGTGLW